MAAAGHRRDPHGSGRRPTAGLHRRAGTVRDGGQPRLRASLRYGRYLKQTRLGLAIDRRAIAAAKRLDGQVVVHSNDDTLSAIDMALGHKPLQRVEEAWRSMKSGLNLRPVFHWAPHRIHAHGAITVLALLLERVAEHACTDTWRTICDDLKRIQLAQLWSPHGTVW